MEGRRRRWEETTRKEEREKERGSWQPSEVRLLKEGSP
jgi:hypothetical protein